MSDRIPIYRLDPADTSTSKLIDVSRRILDIGDDFQLTRRGNSRVLRSGPRVVEVASERGGIWAADESQLWNPSSRPKLLTEDQAVSHEERTLRDIAVLPNLNPPFRFGPPVVGGTHFATKAAKDARREVRRL